MHGLEIIKFILKDNYFNELILIQETWHVCRILPFKTIKNKEMKTIFTSILLMSGLLIFGQEAGKAGELLKNEASKTEMQTKKTDAGFRTNNNSNNRIPSTNNNKGGVLDNSDFRNPNGSNSNNYPSNSNSNSDFNYRWNQNYGYAEVFLRIPENGYFSVEVGDQMISNASGKFRFFDLSSGRIPISIYQNGYLVYRSQLSVSNNNRMVLDFFTNKGLYLLDNYSVQGQTYGVNQWDDVWNNPYNNGGFNNGNNGNNWGNSYDNSGYGNVMNNQVFSQFMTAMLREASFDNNKRDFIVQQLRNSQFNSRQIAAMLKEFSFDSNRLEMAKQLYSSCVDRGNFFVVLESFTYQSTKDELKRFITKS